MLRKQFRIDHSTNVGLLMASRKINASKTPADTETSSAIVVFVSRAGLAMPGSNRVINVEGLRHV